MTTIYQIGRRHMTAFALVMCVLAGWAEDLIFDVAESETYSVKIGSQCERIVKNGTGTLTLTATEDADFTGTVEISVIQRPSSSLLARRLI